MRNRIDHIALSWWLNTAVGGVSTLASALSVNKAGAVLTGGFSYSDMNGDLESNQLPEVFELEIVGTFNVNTLHSVSKAFYHKGGKSESGSLIKWYQSDDENGTGESVISTSATFTPLVVGKYLRLGYTPRISDGTLGVEILTDRYVVNSAFNFSDIAWFTLHVPAGASDIGTNGYWRNDGSGGHSAVETNAPTWDATEQAMKFVSASAQRLLLDLPAVALSRPVELWMRVKFTTVNAAMDLIRFTNSHGLSLVSGGAVRASMSSGSVDTFVINTWYTVRFVVMPNANESIYNRNNGAVFSNTVPANTGSFATADGRIASSYSGATNYFNGFISHIMLKQGALSAPEELNMWTKFNSL